MNVSRRAFATSILSTAAALPFTPLIGEVAGGLYVLAPLNLREYVSVYGPSASQYHLGSVLRGACYVAWAPPGAKRAALQLWAGTTRVSDLDPPRLIEARRMNLIQSFADCWEQDHYPGWLRVHRSEPDGGVDDEGVPTMRTWREWTRVGYLRWMKPHELRSPSIEVPRG